MAFILLSLLLAPFASADGWNFEPNTAVWGIVTQRRPVEASLNPENRFLRVPERTLALEARPDWRLGYGAWKLTARPRLILARDTVEAARVRSNDTSALLRWSEGFLGWNATDSFSFHYGLQNFQWGPAESASPSNRIFRDNVQVKDSLYSVKGKHLFRAGWTPSNAFSEVFLAELSGNGDPEPEPYALHSRKAALKSEVSWAGGADYAGLVLGWRDRAGFWIGEYLNLEPIEGFSAYADLSHQQGSEAWYPNRTATGRTYFAPSRRHEDKIYTFSVTGLRYAFENGNDLRFEWLRQEAGYSAAELSEARLAVASRDPVQLLALARAPAAAGRSGLDFPGVNYLFTSIRFPNALNFRDWNLFFRALYSLQDHSSGLFASSEHAIGENGNLIASVGSSLGADDKELKGAVDMSGTLAYRHAW